MVASSSRTSKGCWLKCGLSGDDPLPILPMRSWLAPVSSPAVIGGRMQPSCCLRAKGPMSNSTPDKKPRVLICEDEGLTALRLKKALSSLGYEVVGEAKNGEEAVALAERLKPDAILMDIRMPKLDGIAATERIMS